MMNQNQNKYTGPAQLAAFQEKVRGLTDKNRSFAATVREVFSTIEPAIKDGTPLEVLLKAINEHYGQNGTLSAFKSALSRIRKETAAMRFLGIRLAPDGSLVLPTHVQTGNAGTGSPLFHSSPRNFEGMPGQVPSGSFIRPVDGWQPPPNWGQYQQGSQTPHRSI